jgi:hypothetical protein
MSLFGLKGNITKSYMDPESSSVLHTVWIKIHKIPDIVRDTESVKEITNLVAGSLVVDELSLVRAEPVRVKVRCRNPSTIKGSIEVFFNRVGVFLRFEVEEPMGGFKKGKGGPPPRPRKPDDSQNREPDNHSKGDKTKFDRMGRLDREMDSNQDDAMEDDLESGGTKDNPQQKPNSVSPLAAFHPEVAKPMTSLLQKDHMFAWTEECVAAFCTLQKLLTTAPILAQPDIEKSFDVFCDASKNGLGCVLI